MLFGCALHFLIVLFMSAAGSAVVNETASAKVCALLSVSFLRQLQQASAPQHFGVWRTCRSDWRIQQFRLVRNLQNLQNMKDKKREIEPFRMHQLRQCKEGQSRSDKRFVQQHGSESHPEVWWAKTHGI